MNVSAAVECNAPTPAEEAEKDEGFTDEDSASSDDDTSSDKEGDGVPKKMDEGPPGQEGGQAGVIGGHKLRQGPFDPAEDKLILEWVSKWVRDSHGKRIEWKVLADKLKRNTKGLSAHYRLVLKKGSNTPLPEDFDRASPLALPTPGLSDPELSIADSANEAEALPPVSEPEPPVSDGDEGSASDGDEGSASDGDEGSAYMYQTWTEEEVRIHSLLVCTV